MVQINNYMKSRDISSDLICHAPFTNLYFNSRGYAGVCWLSFVYTSEFRYPNKSIRDIWFDSFKRLREKIKAKDLSSCQVCKNNIERGNYITTLARAYDHLDPCSRYPKMLELELGNTCNLECIMCFGELSSQIRKNREKKPPLISPYDEEFVRQLEEFIPHLVEIRLNGGESWLIDINYKIIDRLISINPKAKITMATNGTILNSKIKEYLKKGNFHINFSLDSLDKNMYEYIRKNAIFEKTMDNFKFYHKFCRENNRTLALMVNPMRINWQEMPKFIEFCDYYDIPLWFNTIVRPKELNLMDLDIDSLREIHKYLSTYKFKQKSRNLKVYDSLVNSQIKSWIIAKQNPT